MFKFYKSAVYSLPEFLSRGELMGWDCFRQDCKIVLVQLGYLFCYLVKNFWPHVTKVQEGFGVTIADFFYALAVKVPDKHE